MSDDILEKLAAGFEMLFSLASGVAVLLSCLRANLPIGPPEFTIQDLNFQLYPIDRIKCPGIDPDKDVVFELYKRSHPTTPHIVNPSNNSTFGAIDFDKETILFFHGFMESSISTDAIDIRNAYLNQRDINVIIVNARRLLAGPSYITASKNVAAIAKYTADLLDQLVTNGMQLSKVHLIGHSLGSHVAGIVGSTVRKGPIARITGLDPAGPFYWYVPESLRLDKSDAEFVDVIHSDSGIFGYSKECGHVDFWPNGGSAIQPGCGADEIAQKNLGSKIFCNHWRAFQYFVESINNSQAFLSKKCGGWSDYLNGKCDSNDEAHMGESASKDYKSYGSYYLNTKYPRPYSL